MRASEGFTLSSLLLLALLTGFSHAKPLDELSKSDTKLSVSNGEGNANKTSVSAGEELNTATNVVLAGNYKYDVEILESGDRENVDHDSNEEELEENFKGHGVHNTDTHSFVAENIEMTPVDVESSSITETHMLLSIVIVVLALVSICLYAGLVIWRSHLEQRYGMRERLVNRDMDEEGIDDGIVVYPHTLSPYAPTTTTRS